MRISDWVQTCALPILFRRLNRRLVLTEAGQLYQPVLRDSFDAIAGGTARLRREQDSGPLHISVLPSLAAKWLLPRMSRFRDRHPEIDVMVSANNKLIDFEDGMFEMAIRSGQGAYPGLRTELLLRDEDRKSTSLHSGPQCATRMPSSAS